MPKKVSDGSEHGAHVLFTDLVKCERQGSTFFVGGRSNNYERTGAMTLEYTRELVAKLTQLLAEHDEERFGKPQPINGISLCVEGETIVFELQNEGKPVAKGRVTMGVGKKARDFLNDLFGPNNVVKLAGKRA